MGIYTHNCVGTNDIERSGRFYDAALGALGIPVGRVGSIHDIAHAVRFLCHPDSGLITGEVLMVDGGWTLA
mgnify:CR=1 FL=1